ncbi:MAG: DNA-methyltransferase [Candidatus Ratteibacteria bacterium]
MDELYKKIVIKEISKETEEIINNIFSFFPKNDIFCDFKNGDLIIFLKELDFFFFKNIILDYIHKYPNHQEVLQKILSNIENIKSYGLKGFKRLYVGYDRERKVKNRIWKEIERGKYFYAIDHNFSKKNNPLPERFINKIIVGDSERVLKEFPDNCTDLILTSPPYNFGLEYQNHKDGVDWKSYFNKLFSIFKECIRILKFGGRIVINVQPLFSDYVPIHHIISNFFLENKLIWKGEIIWEKHNYNCKYTAWGSWKSPSNPYLKYTWEFLEIFCKGSLKHCGNYKKIDITADEFKKWVYAKWEINPEYNMRKYGHPAMFPEELCERVIKLFSFKGDVVLDPFNGVGTTTVVAKRLSRIYVGIDISEEYCKKAEERIKEEDSKITLL